MLLFFSYDEMTLGELVLVELVFLMDIGGFLWLEHFAILQMQVVQSYTVCISLLVDFYGHCSRFSLNLISHIFAIAFPSSIPAFVSLYYP